MDTQERQNDTVRDQFSKQAASYAALMRETSRDPLAGLPEAARATARDHALDVGCGAGDFAVALAGVCRHVTAIDLTSAMLEQGRANQLKSGVKNITWVEGDVTALPFPDGAFNLVVSRSMFHHVVSARAVLAEMQRVCAADGRILLSDLTPSPEKAPAFDALETLRDPSHVHAHSIKELRAIGADLGLVEQCVCPTETRIPLDAVLATSFPPEGMLEKVRRLWSADAESGFDVFGMRAELEAGAIWVTYPTTQFVWSLSR